MPGDERQGDAAASIGLPVYWAGPRTDISYELTLTEAARLFVRYLPAGVEAGDPRADFLTVATYPLPNPAAAVRAAARARDGRVRAAPAAGVAFSESPAAERALYAERGGEAQVEVYAPSPGEALGLVLGGAIEPIR